MPIPGLLAGLEEGMAAEVAKTRQSQREREDREFTQQLQMLDQLRQDPRTTPELYQKVMQDTLTLQKGLGSQRKPKGGMRGFMGQTETEPYHSNLLQQLASGELPLFQDKAAFDTARSGTSSDFHQAVGDAISGGAAQPAGAVPPAPVAAPPQGPISSQVNSATPPMQGSPAAGGQPSAGAGAPAGGPPPGPVPSPPGTGKMMGAATDLSTQVGRSGPVLPQPPSSADIMKRHAQQPSAFYNPDEMAQMAASASTQAIPYQAKGDYDALIAAGMEPRLATLAVARKLTGFTGGITSQEGPQYVDGADGQLFKSVIHKDAYGSFYEEDPRSGQPLDRSKATLYVPGDFQAQTDKQGNVRYVKKSAAMAGVPGAVGPSLGPIGKPQIPPPAFSGSQVVYGQNGEPQIFGVPRQGGTLVPMQVPDTSAAVPPPPQPGQAPTRPAVRFQLAKPLSAQAETSLQAVNVVQQSGEAALKLIDQLEAQGSAMNNPIPQEIQFKIYQMGWPNSNELEDQLQQLLGVNQVNGMKNYMGGRPNQRLIEIIQAHLPEPGDSLELSRRKLTELKQVTQWVHDAIIQAGSQYRQQPFPVPGQGNTPGGPAASGAGVAPPPPKWSNSGSGPKK